MDALDGFETGAIDDGPVDALDRTLVDLVWPWVFIPVLLFQGALLHPCLRGSRLARGARIAAAPFVVYSALAFPLRVYFTPVEYSVTLNLALVAAHSAHLACLGVQWAAVRGPYWRIGRKEETATGKPSDVKTLEASQDYRYPGILGLARFAVDMLINARGVGWSYGPPRSVLPPPRPETVPSFIRRQLLGIAVLHSLLLLVVSYTIPAYANQQPDQVWTYYTRGEPPSWFRPAAKYVGTLCYGLAGWSGLEMAHRSLNLSKLAFTAASRAVLPAAVAPNPFHPSDYPPLTHRPYARTSVYEFWSFGWHCMLRNDFVICGSVPWAWFFGRFGKTAGRIGAVLGAFAVSGLFHEYTLWISTYPDVFFRTFRFFFGQGVGVVLEYVFTRASGIKVCGALGWSWTVFWLVWFAEPMVTCWFTRDLQRGLLLPHEWGWRTYLVPFAATTPVIPKVEAAAAAL